MKKKKGELRGPSQKGNYKGRPRKSPTGNRSTGVHRPKRLMNGAESGVDGAKGRESTT